MTPWRVSILVLLLFVGANVQASTRIVSLNPCFDEWVPQWLPSTHEFIASDQHGNRLERLLALQPDVILYGTYTNRRLIAELKKTTIAIEVAEPNTWQQWQETLVDLGRQLHLDSELAQWAKQQQQQLRDVTVSNQSILFVMPNQYSWGEHSFAVNLLRSFGARTLVTETQTTIHQVTLEQLIHTQPERVVLDGFSGHYARANEWLWHNALQPWLAKRQLRHIPTPVSGCPAQQAVGFFTEAASI
ncbi:MAG: ABC transporter substrate-binding protein [Gammaproteobacteria bacterium]|nr:ABC transporter substrate-binding protein [Gammaproteobacteria bacterium]